MRFKLALMFAAFAVMVCLLAVCFRPGRTVTVPVSNAPAPGTGNAAGAGHPAGMPPVPPAATRPGMAHLPVAPVSAAERSARLVDLILQQWNTGDGANAWVLTNGLPALLELDPAAAARLAMKVGPEAGRETLLHRVAQGWAAKDAAAAQAWAEQLADPGERRETLVDVAGELAKGNPLGAIALAERQRLDEGGGAVVENIAGGWAARDLPAALAWVAQQPAGERRDQIMARLAFVEAQSAPLDAANRVVREIPSGPVQEEAVMSVLNQWAMQDLPAATAWVERFPAGSFRDRAAAELAGILHYQQMAGAPAGTVNNGGAKP
jgi:hypothetical protein